MSGAGWLRNLEKPRYTCESKGFITNGKGEGFTMHAGTRYKEMAALCAYLDELEEDRARLKGLEK